jgi:hypothetical protein
MIVKVDATRLPELAPFNPRQQPIACGVLVADALGGVVLEILEHDARLTSRSRSKDRGWLAGRVRLVRQRGSLFTKNDLFVGEQAVAGQRASHAEHARARRRAPLLFDDALSLDGLRQPSSQTPRAMPAGAAGTGRACRTRRAAAIKRLPDVISHQC